MLLSVRISIYECTWEVWRALKKPELLSAAPRATLTHFSCSPNFPRASITRYTHAKHEQILKYNSFFFLIFIQLCNSRKIYYLTREFRVKFYLKTDIALIAPRFGFRVQFNAEFPRQVMNFPIEYLK